MRMRFCRADAGLNSASCPPCFQIMCGVQDSPYRDPAVDHKVEHAIGKTAQLGVSNAAMDLRLEE